MTETNPNGNFDDPIKVRESVMINLDTVAADQRSIIDPRPVPPVPVPPDPWILKSWWKGDGDAVDSVSGHDMVWGESVPEDYDEDGGFKLNGVRGSGACASIMAPQHTDFVMQETDRWKLEFEMIPIHLVEPDTYTREHGGDPEANFDGRASVICGNHDGSPGSRKWQLVINESGIITVTFEDQSTYTYSTPITWNAINPFAIEYENGDFTLKLAGVELIPTEGKTQHLFSENLNEQYTYSLGYNWSSGLSIEPYSIIKNIKFYPYGGS